jgi:hypothetical protein
MGDGTHTGWDPTGQCHELVRHGERPAVKSGQTT